MYGLISDYVWFISDYVWHILWLCRIRFFSWLWIVFEHCSAWGNRVWYLVIISANTVKINIVLGLKNRIYNSEAGANGPCGDLWFSTLRIYLAAK